ncbi:GNAT family N-acetyltransferase [Singulisphaera rosea]
MTIARQSEQTSMPAIRSMFLDYADSMGLDLEFQGFSEELASLPGKYAPPSGCILLATVEAEPAGCVALRALGDGVCEMKRLFVDPRFRGLKLGRKLAGRVIEEARTLGYDRGCGSTPSPRGSGTRSPSIGRWASAKSLPTATARSPTQHSWNWIYVE